MSRIWPVGLSDRRNAMDSSATAAMNPLEAPPYSPLSFTPAIRQAAPFGPYSLALYPCPGNTMPSADSRIRDGLTLRLAHSALCPLSHPYLCVPLPQIGRGSSAAWMRCACQRRGFCFTGGPWPSGQFQRQPPPRRSGSPGVSSGYFQRTIVRYT
jgi:hypothetical protein